MDNKLYKLMNWPEIESIIYSECDSPQDILGMHTVGQNQLVQAFFPNAEYVNVLNLSDDKTYHMEKVDEEGFFACLIPSKKSFKHEYIIEDKNGEVSNSPEVYDIIPQFWLSLLDRFKEGTLYDSYRYFGAHVTEIKGVLGTSFFVYAPNAVRVSVVGDFNDWDGRVNPMCKINDCGIYALFIPGLSQGHLYKYEIKLRNGLTFLKRDPYAFSIEKGDNDASVISLDFEYENAKYKRNKQPQNLSILSLSLEDYLKEDGSLDSKSILNYVKKSGFNAVLTDDLSFCKKIVTKYGKPSLYSLSPKLSVNDLETLIDSLHKENISVFTTIDLSGFIPDDCGLRGFDGSKIYEYDDREIDLTLSFNFDNSYVRNYLLSLCDYYVKRFDLDGLCIGGIDRILYLDYKRNDGEWSANMYGTNENLGGVEFLKHLNSIMHKRYSNICMIAKDSLVSDNLTKDLSDFGIGFDYKLHTGFTKEAITYFHYDSNERKEHYNELFELTIGMYCEKHILPILNSQIGCERESIYSFFSGIEEDKASNLRLLLSLIYLLPGRKCLPLFKDADEKLEAFFEFLNSFYFDNEFDDEDSEAFDWVDFADSNHDVISFVRKAKDKEYLVVMNFSDATFKRGIEVKEGLYKEVFSSSLSKFGGNERLSSKLKETKAKKGNAGKREITLNLNPLCAYVYEKTPCQK